MLYLLELLQPQCGAKVGAASVCTCFSPQLLSGASPSQLLQLDVELPLSLVQA